MNDFAFLAAPARRALANAGIRDFAALAEMTEPELRALHGIGPNAVSALKTEMALRKLRFAEN